MPKYFDEEVRLPYPVERVLLEDVSAARISELLVRHGDVLSLCVRFPGFEGDCLGYVFNIKRGPDAFDISDITGKALLTVDSDTDLVAMIYHVSGARFDPHWQGVFQQLRNQITSER